jgi:hypothetical protein
MSKRKAKARKAKMEKDRLYQTEFLVWVMGLIELTPETPEPGVICWRDEKDPAARGMLSHRDGDVWLCWASPGWFEEPEGDNEREGIALGIFGPNVLDLSLSLQTEEDVVRFCVEKFVPAVKPWCAEGYSARIRAKYPELWGGEK